MVPHATLAALSVEAYKAADISVGSVQAIVREVDGEMVVAFRGTDEFADWFVIDADTRFVHPWLDARGLHSGFWHAYEDVEKELHDAIVGCGVTWCGHSLGGALAMLAAYEHDVHPRAVVTFGGPRVGNAAWAADYADVLGDRTHRYVRAGDPVPLLPGALVGYRHPNCAVTYFAEDGTIQSSVGLWAQLRDLAKFSRVHKGGWMDDAIAGHSSEAYARDVERVRGLAMVA